jgi:uncharacterized 2Fe-2S/4Fe-4S cluster protein (DUF4445 family)
MRVSADPGTKLESILAARGMEFPCGGAGICRGCRVRVVEGRLAITAEMEQVFSEAELREGWRLACCSVVEGPLVLEIPQWDTPVLSDDTPLAFEPGQGVGIAIDLGTTTLVAQSVDLRSGAVLGVQTGLNPQAAHGADVMTRIEFALSGGAADLARSIRECLGGMIACLPGHTEAHTVLLAGNTAMHHLFCGIDSAPLAAVPFRPANDGEQVLPVRELGWDLPETAAVRFLPCLGGFVGSDLLAGILATGIHKSAELRALIDLGTNGEIVLGKAGRILCASTAAGPAFEAGRIRMGMRAAAGAVSHVAIRGGAFECRTIGDGPPQGICGSGLVDAVAAGLESGAILPNGRLANGRRELELCGPVRITQQDIRELQLAKGAIAAGLRLLAERWGAALDEIETVYLAGAFGNYVRIESARRIGLLEVAPERVVPSGNTALRGAKMALLGHAAEIRAVTEHVPLAEDPRFQDTFVECLSFSGRATQPAVKFD